MLLPHGDMHMIGAVKFAGGIVGACLRCATLLFGAEIGGLM